jgi:hypothetical protein
MHPNDVPIVRREGQRDKTVESHGQDETVVVVRVLTDEIDPTGGHGDTRMGIPAVNLMKTPARRVTQIGE